ncbi:hypothetical protein JCM10212_000241 [Sporobolomyces blumeae]
MPSAPLPDAFVAWYRTNYASVSFNPEWIDACVDYIRDTNPASRTSTAALIQAVQLQLLSSDLSTSVVPPDSCPFPIAWTNSGTNRDVKVLWPGGLKKGYLVQVEQVDDVSHSAQTLLDTMHDKREHVKLESKGLTGQVGAGRNMDLDDDDDDDGPNPNDDDAIPRRGGEQNRGGAAASQAGKRPTYPRGNGKFVVSDGKWQVDAFELERIPQLGLEQIQLGTKLWLHDVPFVNNVLLLTPNNTVVKGYSVEELENEAERTLENALRRRLGLEPLAQDSTDAPAEDDRQPDPEPEPEHGRSGGSSREAAQPRAGPSHGVTRRNNTASQQDERGGGGRTPRVEKRPVNRDDDEDEYFDDSFIADFDVDAIGPQATKPARSGVGAKTEPRLGSSDKKGKGKTMEQDDDDDDEMMYAEFERGREMEEQDEDEDDAWAAMNEVENRGEPKKSGSGSRGQPGGRTATNGTSVDKSAPDRGVPRPAAPAKDPRPPSSGTSTDRKPVDVVLLDSDDDDGDADSRAAVTSGRKRLRRGGGPRATQQVGVLELGDSD